MPSTDNRDRTVLLVFAVVALLALVYAVVVSRDVLEWFAVVVPFVTLYLLWRFVRAHERIADALE